MNQLISYMHDKFLRDKSFSKCVLTGFLALIMSAGFLRAEDLNWNNVVGANFLSPIRNQGSGGMCWAFAATADLEAMYKITRNDPNYSPDLSEQQLACASVGDANMGGYPSNALQYFQNTGVVTEQALPYTATNTSPYWPLASGWQNRTYKIDSYTISQYPTGTWNADTIKSYLKSYGPVITGMQADNDFYGAGNGSYRGAHAVLIVGFHDDASLSGGGYFIVKNSWGTSWGTQGYGKILYSTFATNSSSRQQCLITSAAYAVGAANTLNWDTSTSSGFQPGSGTWSTNSGRWSTNGITLNNWRNGEDAAVFTGSGGPYTVNVDNNISTHAITFQNGASGYTLTGGSLTITNGGIAANDNALIQSDVTVGAPQQWTVAGGKTLSIAGAVNTHISRLTVSGQGDTLIQGVIRDVRADARYNGLLTSFSGSLAKSGGGTLTLTAANNYTGATEVDAGTLALSGANGSILSSAVNVKGGKLLIDNSTDNNLHRIAASTGATMQGGELALLGNSAGTSETIDNLVLDTGHSTVTVVADTNASSLLAPNLNRTTGATALVRGNDLGNSGSGAIGRIQFTTSPVLSNSGSGDQAGIVPYLIGENNISGSGSDLVTYGADGLRPLAGSEYASSLSADRNVKLTDTAAATDALNVRSLVLGNNSAGTQLTVNSGNTLTVASGAILSAGSAANTISGGSITFGNNDATGYEGIVHTVSDMTIQSVIANNSAYHYVSLTKGGTGILTLTANNTYLGTTTISGGTLQIGDGGTTGSIAGQMIVDNAAMVFNRSDTVTYAGTISGSGSLTKVGNNTLILLGDNNYTGLTTIQNGTLQLGNGNWSGSIVGDVINNAELIFNRTTNLSYNGVISGNGHLTQIGAGILTLFNENTYTGGTTIQGGTLQLGGFSQAGSTIFTGSIQGNVIDNGTLTFFCGDKTFGGDISGTGQVKKTGMNFGTLTLTGNNTYTGNTIVDTYSSLQIGNGGTYGSITSNVTLGYVSTLIFNRSDNTTYNGNVSSAADSHCTFSKLGAGILSLTGNITHSGGTTISAGTLQIGNGGTTGSITGNITDNATLAFNRSDNITFSDAVSGTGVLRKKGDGVLTFTNNNTYTGGTFIDNGTLQIGNGGSSGSIIGNVTANGTLAFNRSDNITFVGAISGTGGILRKKGSGVLALIGNNMYTGGTIIDNGTLQIGTGGTSGSIIGNVTNNGTLAFNHSDNISFSGVCIGGGGLTKLGSGMLTLNNANTYSGDTIIKSGTLKLDINGSLKSNLIDIAAGTFDVSSKSEYILDTGQTIKGVGSIIGDMTVLGSVAPGERTGTLSAGNMTFGNGSLLDVELGGTVPGTSYDMLNSTGTLTLQTGSTLMLSFLDNFSPNPGNLFDILNFSSLSGTFSTLDLPALNSGLFWDTSDLYQDGIVLVVPEPAISVLILSALAALLCCKIVRRRGETHVLEVAGG